MENFELCVSQQLISIDRTGDVAAIQLHLALLSYLFSDIFTHKHLIALIKRQFATLFALDSVDIFANLSVLINYTSLLIIISGSAVRAVFVIFSETGEQQYGFEAKTPQRLWTIPPRAWSRICAGLNITILRLRVPRRA